MHSTRFTLPESVRRIAALGVPAILLLAGVLGAPAAAALSAESSAAGRAQTFSVGQVVAPDIERDAYRVTTFSTVQWPLNPSTPIADRFGPRIAPCAGCSTYHQGVDWNPGAGAPIAAIADGVVTEVGNPSGGLGVYAVVEHDIDGEIVSSVYAHLRYGTLALRVGQHVKRGAIVGLVGTTGQSTGPHLHFSIRDAAGTAIAPLPWLRSHVTESWGTH